MFGTTAAGQLGRLATIASLGFVAALGARDGLAAPLGGIPWAPQMAVPAEASPDEESLRETLAAAGVEVNIAGGLGMSEMDPIVILDHDPKAAAATRIRVIDSIHLLTGTYWREHEESAEGSGAYRFHQVSVDDGRPNRDAGGVFFDVSRADPTGAGLPDPNTHIIAGWGMAPHEIGWVHYQRVVDFESQRPGTGYGLEYRGPDMVLTVYVYRGADQAGPPAAIEAEPVGAEFGAALDEVTASYPSAVKLLGEAVRDDSFHRQTMVVADVWSVVGLTVDEGHYVKYRLSCADNPATIDIAEQTIDAIGKVVAKE